MAYNIKTIMLSRDGLKYQNNYAVERWFVISRQLCCREMAYNIKTIMLSRDGL